MAGMVESPVSRVVFRCGSGPIFNRRATERVYDGALVAFGKAFGVARTGAVGYAEPGEMYALHLGGEWLFPRTDTAAAAFGAKYVWSAAAADGAGAMIPATDGAASAMVCEGTAEGVASACMLLLLPAAT